VKEAITGERMLTSGDVHTILTRKLKNRR